MVLSSRKEVGKMKKNRKSFPLKPILLLSAAALLLLGSAIGSARAALTYYSENYSAQVNMSSIGVTLLENGREISSRNYANNGTWVATEGNLLENMLDKGSKLTPGKKYNEALSVKNSGNIDIFVRVIITKSWQNKEGQKATELSPELIELNLTGNGWEQASAPSSPERMVLYYSNVVASGETTPELSDTIRIDNKIARMVTKNVSKDGKTIQYVYDYDGYTINLDAEVNAVQANNAKDAIKSAWGVDVNVSSDATSISLQ